MRSLEADLAHSPKRRRVSSESAEITKTATAMQVLRMRRPTILETMTRDRQLRSGSDFSEDTAEYYMWAMRLQKWPLPANHPEAGNMETLHTSIRTYVNWVGYLYAVNYWEKRPAFAAWHCSLA